MADMANVTQIVREVEQRRADDLNTLLRLWNDPRFADVVALLRNGQAPQPSNMHVRRRTPAPGSHANSGLRDAIRSLKGQLPAFTPDNVLAALQAGGFNGWGTRDPKAAIRDTLRKLCDRKELKKKKRGRGGAQNMYEWRMDEERIA